MKINTVKHLTFGPFRLTLDRGLRGWIVKLTFGKGAGHLWGWTAYAGRRVMVYGRVNAERGWAWHERPVAIGTTRSAPAVPYVAY